ncbi:V-type ATP synthase subunit D [Patescibacteria group bacterium]|nr:V-type ATP synthase subunit D [Patescibacteria group bacterium]
MAKLNVNPTRMELLKLKKRVKTATRGHKLLKEKRDGLMKSFMSVIREAKDLRGKVEQDLGTAFKNFMFASASMRKESINEALAVPTQKMSLEATTKNVMSVNVPRFKANIKGDFLCYSLASTSADLDDSLKTFAGVLEDLIRLAEIEHSAYLLACEIEKTRRRVNALEHVMIPNMNETVKYITMKLSEQERAAITSIMAIKDKLT